MVGREAWKIGVILTLMIAITATVLVWQFEEPASKAQGEIRPPRGVAALPENDATAFERRTKPVPKPGAPVAFDFEFAGSVKLGVDCEVDVTLTAGHATTLIECVATSTDSVTVVDGELAQSAAAGETIEARFVVRPEAHGKSYVPVRVSMLGPDGTTTSRAFAIPISCGSAEARPSEVFTKTDERGTPIKVMKARQFVR